MSACGPAWFEWLPAWLELVVITGTAIFGLWTFHRQARVRRAEWLQALYRQFFEDDRYKAIRRHLDYKSAEFQAFVDACNEGRDCDSAFEEPLVDYLNFFEFVANLSKMEQMTDQEVKALFEYYLQNLAESEPLVRYIGDNGFEALAALLKRR